jgi:DNA ligase-1
MLLADIVATSQRIADTSSRLAKIAALADCLRRLEPDEIAIGVHYLSGEVPQKRLGVGYALIRDARTEHGSSVPALTLVEVDRALTTLGATAGAGSASERRRLLSHLFARATQSEQDFLMRLLVGELRQGALEGIMQEALARAAGLPARDVRKAAMLAGGLAPVAQAALVEGAAGLRRFSLRLFQPVQPMLAQPADEIGDALAQLGSAALEWKLDGARVQVHKSGDDIRIFTRSLNDVTRAAPEIVEAVRALPARDLILDGETIALRRDGSPQSFQMTMRRFGRKLDVARMRTELPLSVQFFDCLHRDGEDLVDEPLHLRFAALADAASSGLIIPRLVTGDPGAAATFFADALRHGHEGVMAKSLHAAYEAGRRGAGWLKVKQANTLDLAVLAAEWGNGRRRGYLSNLHLGARDPVNGGFVMLGKTFKGMTDQILAWQTEALLKLEVSRDSYTVYVKPELVVEIACNEIQASSQYPGGLALRFARLKRYRLDKRAEETNTIEDIRAIHARQEGRER